MIETIGMYLQFPFVRYALIVGILIALCSYYTAFEDTEGGIVYHACVIPDATACCAQGIEFLWGGEHQWPDD